MRMASLIEVFYFLSKGVSYEAESLDIRLNGLFKGYLNIVSYVTKHFVNLNTQ